jgi:hypothetical protein
MMNCTYDTGNRNSEPRPIPSPRDDTAAPVESWLPHSCHTYPYDASGSRSGIIEPALCLTNMTYDAVGRELVDEPVVVTVPRPPEGAEG